MSRQFIIVDPTDDISLLLCQYISMGWHDADVEEMSLEDLDQSDDPLADVIIIGGIDPDNSTLKKIVAKSQAGEIPPLIILVNEEEMEETEYSGFTAALSLEDLTPLLLNSAIVELIKLQKEDSALVRTDDGRNPDRRADNEVPMEKIEGLKGYRLISELGRGGMSRVFQAKRNSDGMEVAIKVLDMETIEDDRMIERFIREYNMLSSVDSRHVAKILDQTFTDEYAFIIMERFHGGDLSKRIRKRIEPLDAMHYLKQIAEGLVAIHAQGIVHRDLKPGNILFRSDGSLALLDFGLAQMDGDDDDLTKHGEVYGTPSYVSPEQARGKRVDHRSDIYSSGIILYQMLTRKKPYRADNPMSMFYKHVHAELPRLPSKFSGYQPLLDKMLAKSPDDRFQDAGELIDALRDYR